MTVFNKFILVFAVLVGQMAVAGYDISTPPIKITFKTSDDKPVPGAAFRAFIGTYKKEFHLLGCGGHDSLPVPRNCWTMIDLTNTNSVGFLFEADASGIMKIPKYHFTNNSDTFRGSEILMEFYAFKTDKAKCKSGYVLPDKATYASNAPSFEKVPGAEGIVAGAFTCEIMGGLDSVNKVQLNLGSANPELVCRFRMDSATLNSLLQSFTPRECVK